MRKFFRESLSPPMVVALLALTLSLGGVGYAAMSVPHNSVGSAQVINHSLRSVDLNREVTSVQRELGSGQTMRGVFLATGDETNGNYLGTAITFPQRLPNDFNRNHVQYKVGTTSARCPGEGRAARGWACFYEGQNNAVDDPPCCIYDEDYNSFAVGTFGVRLYWNATGANYVDGTWAIRPR